MKPCGTLSAYARHIRRKEPTCQPCKDANAIRRRQYYKENSKRVYNINRKWAKNNSEKVKSYSRRITAKRKALKLFNGQEKYTEEEVLKKYGTDCYICSNPIDLSAKRQSSGEGWQYGLHLDHLIPLSRGGPDTIDNIRPTHAICNMKKHNLRTHY